MASGRIKNDYLKKFSIKTINKPEQVKVQVFLTINTNKNLIIRTVFTLLNINKL